MVRLRKSDFIAPLLPTNSPEDILSDMTGTCAKWQIYIVTAMFLSEYFHGLNFYSTLLIAPKQINYKCLNSTEKCTTIDGTPCKKFEFSDEYRGTVNEKYLLVCGNEYKIQYVAITFYSGLIISYLVTGILADRYGKKNISLIFIALQSISGMIPISTNIFWIFLVFRFMFGLFSCALHILPELMVTEMVGNNWRTLNLGLINLAIGLSILTLPYIAFSVADYAKLILVFCMFNLIVLILLLFIDDPPSWLVLKNRIRKAEENLKGIARFNSVQIPSNFRLKPLDIIDGHPLTHSYFCTIFKHPETRWPFICLELIWLITGFTFSFIVQFILLDTNNQMMKMLTVSAGCLLAAAILGIILCHLIQHRVIIACSHLLGDIFIGVAVKFDDKLGTESVNFVYKLLAIFWLYLSLATIKNLTPRVFSIDIRAQCYGICLSLFYIGWMGSAFIFLPMLQGSIWINVGIYQILCPVTVIICCLFLPNVHRRELPDLLIDAVNFKTEYKPHRFLPLRDWATTINESEVRMVDLLATTGRSASQDDMVLPEKYSRDLL